MGAKKQLDANKTGWPEGWAAQFKSFDHFKKWYDPRYKNVKAETIYKKIGGVIPTKKDKPQD